VPTDNRTVFLQAGEALLAEQATEVTLRSLTVRAVTKRARRSTGAFYHYWETQADYVRDLLPYLMRWDAMLEQDPALDRIQAAAPEQMEAAFIVRMFDGAIDAMTATTVGRLEWLLFSMVDDASVRVILHDLYREYADMFAAEYERLLGSVGLRPATGMTWIDVATMITAALDGLALRRSIDPERASSETAARMLAAILTSVLVPTGTGGHSSPLERLEALLGDHQRAGA
jgi:AcrR family transcriptional regulator